MHLVTHQCILFFYSSGQRNNHCKSDSHLILRSRETREIWFLSIGAEKCQDGFIGQGRMHMDLWVAVRVRRVHITIACCDLGLDDSFDDYTDWHIVPFLDDPWINLAKVACLSHPVVAKVFPLHYPFLPKSADCNFERVTASQNIITEVVSATQHM